MAEADDKLDGQTLAGIAEQVRSIIASRLNYPHEVEPIGRLFLEREWAQRVARRSRPMGEPLRRSSRAAQHAGRDVRDLQPGPGADASRTALISPTRSRG